MVVNSVSYLGPRGSPLTSLFDPYGLPRPFVPGLRANPPRGSSVRTLPFAPSLLLHFRRHPGTLDVSGSPGSPCLRLSPPSNQLFVVVRLHCTHSGFRKLNLPLNLFTETDTPKCQSGCDTKVHFSPPLFLFPFLKIPKTNFPLLTGCCYSTPAHSSAQAPTEGRHCSGGRV